MFAHDVTAVMLVFQFKRILVKLFCLDRNINMAAMAFVEFVPGE
jgi:hypothetical protein